jgi:hypothetical protein
MQLAVGPTFPLGKIKKISSLTDKTEELVISLSYSHRQESFLPIYTAYSIKVVTKQSKKVEYVREILAGSGD